MQTSTNTEYIAKLVGDERAVEYIAKAGFDAWDFSLFRLAQMDWANNVVRLDVPPFDNPLKLARAMRRVGEDNGIKCNQSHAPFPVNIKSVSDRLKLALECTAEAGGEICVIHPDNNKSAMANAEFYSELLPFAKSVGVKIATENMFNWNGKGAESAACSNHDDFLKHMMAIDDPYFVACVDVGHAEMKGLDTSAEKMILTLGKYVKALHLHDNDLQFDRHEIPFSMKIDFSKIVKALKEIEYDGYFTLEADSYVAKNSQAEPKKIIANLYDSVKRLADEFESL